jgi:hypothetical protein
MSTWLDQIFDADAANNGGIVRRNRQDVNKNCGRDALIEEVKERGFHLIETGNQYVIFCHTGALRIHC